MVCDLHLHPMPLDQCFEIIKNGAEHDFDPFLVEIFLKNRKKIKMLYEQLG